MDDPERRHTMIAARERGPGPGRYWLPSTVGSKGHDCTKHQKPAYSFGARLDNSKFSKDVSPGPKYLVESRFTRLGPEGEPKYSMLARQPELKPFKTPGPGAYRVESVPHLNERCAPRYSLSARTQYRKYDSTPSANAYKLPSGLGSRVPNKPSSACYSLRGRTDNLGFSEDLAKTPGPAGYKVTNYDTIRRAAPQYSLGVRCRMPGDSTKKPGPGAHNAERVTYHMKSNPSFTMGTRHSEFITPLIIDSFSVK